MTRQDFISVFRDAGWLTHERIRLWATAFGIAWLVFLVFDASMHLIPGSADIKGEHIGHDFINYWSGALLAEQGRAKTAYDINTYIAFQQTLAAPDFGPRLYSYPPVAMLLTLPLALCSFLVGFFLWTAAGYALCVKMFSRYVSLRLALVTALAAPACLLNIHTGQNGFFTAALFAGGLMLLERRPVLAGILIGLLCYKPQMGLMIPLALLAGGYGRSFIAAGLTVAGLLITTTFLCGFDIWPAFIGQMRIQADFAARGDTLWHRMPTVFCALRKLGVPATAAGLAQGISALCAAWYVIKTWRGKASQDVKSAVLVLATFLATPYAWDYDMVVVIFALFWIIREAQRTGWLPWEKFSWMTLVLMPLPMMFIAKFTVVQPGAAVLWWVFWLTLGRVKQSA